MDGSEERVCPPWASDFSCAKIVLPLRDLIQEPLGLKDSDCDCPLKGDLLNQCKAVTSYSY